MLVPDEGFDEGGVDLRLGIRSVLAGPRRQRYARAPGRPTVIVVAGPRALRCPGERQRGFGMAQMTRDDIDLLDGNWYAAQPYEQWAWMRRNAPVYRDERNDVWGIALYEDVLAIEKDAKTFSSARAPRPHGDPLPMMISMDNPRAPAAPLAGEPGLHARRRCRPTPTPSEPSARGSSTRSREKGSCDFVWDIAAPLPLLLIADMLGFPPEAYDDLLTWSDDMMRGTTGQPHARGPAGGA